MREGLAAGLPVLIDATNTIAWQRKAVLDIAAEYDALTYAVVFTTPLDECLKRNKARERTVPEHVTVKKHRECSQLTYEILETEGFHEALFTR